MTSLARPHIAITMGDPAGIGPELCLRLFAHAHTKDLCVPIVLGDASILARVSQRLGLKMPASVISPAQPSRALRELSEPTVVDLHAIDEPAGIEPGRVSATTGRAAFNYIEHSIEAALSGDVDAVVTGPIHKEALRAAGVPFPGHTEIYAARTEARRACMALTCPDLTCTFVTVHVGYRDVPRLLSVQRVLDVIGLTAAFVRRMQSREPRLAVCGLNPHAGEHGLFGDREEERIIVPAIEAARAQGLTIDGPLPPDTAFLPARRRETDAFVCMYHDQGHIPLKALAFDQAVNVTLGLPIIRTSVDHGTALDIAWQGKANPTSLFEAVRIAAALAAPGPGGLP
ncbi:MAG TPA: 4-hydroxythreonine-4-phosphate dehydrogenase PdxA [Tepidisphaeraceae bacterium]|jgi:4-hydroxythreonine-4-phosphate dehydrogenase